MSNEQQAHEFKAGYGSVILCGVIVNGRTCGRGKGAAIHRLVSDTPQPPDGDITVWPPRHLSASEPQAVPPDTIWIAGGEHLPKGKDAALFTTCPEDDSDISYTRTSTTDALAARIPDRAIARIEQRTGRDCLRCCVAMVTQVNYEDVPDFCAEHKEAWPTALGEWLHMLGMGLLMFGNAAPEYVPSWLPIIAQGRTDRSSLLHFVVVTSDAVIDPSPYQSGLIEITDRYAIVNSGALANGFIEHLGKNHSALASTTAALADALRGLSTRMFESGPCWCDIPNPEMGAHMPECAAAREALARWEGKEGL